MSVSEGTASVAELGSTADQLAMALKKNAMLLEKIDMLKAAYQNKSEELQNEKGKANTATVAIIAKAR